MRCVPDRKYVSAMFHRAGPATWRERLCCDLPYRLLFEWHRVQSVPGHLRHLHWSKRLRDLHRGLGDAAAEWHKLRRDVLNGHVPVRHPVLGLQQQLCGLHDHSDHLYHVPGGPGAQHADQHMRRVLPDRLCCSGLSLQSVRFGLLRADVPAVLVRHWRRVQPGDCWHGRVHVQHGLHPIQPWRALQYVFVCILPLRHLLLALPGELHDVLHEYDLHPVRRIAPRAARRDLVRNGLPERRVRQRDRLRHLCAELPDVLWRWQRCVLHVQRDVNLAVPEREHLRGHLPGRDLHRRQQRLHRVQLQLRNVHGFGHDVRDLHSAVAA